MKHCSEVITHNILHLKNKQFETMFSLCCWAPQRKLPIYFISNKLMFKMKEFIMKLVINFLGQRSKVEHIFRQ